MIQINREVYSRTEKTQDRWETPPNLFFALQYYIKRKYNREFSLDSAASQQNHLCEKYFTKNENGLIQDWSDECVFCNPPYSDIENWVKKCYDEGQNTYTIVALLIPVRSDTQYWHKYCMKADRILFCKGRVNFLLDGKKPENGSTFPSAIIIFRETNKKFPLIRPFDYKNYHIGPTLKKFIQEVEK